MSLRCYDASTDSAASMRPGQRSPGNERLYGYTIHNILQGYFRAVVSCRQVTDLHAVSNCLYTSLFLIFQRSYLQRELPGKSTSQERSPEIGKKNHTITGFFSIASNGLPMLVTLGLTESAGPISIISTWSLVRSIICFNSSFMRIY